MAFGIRVRSTLVAALAALALGVGLPTAATADPVAAGATGAAPRWSTAKLPGGAAVLSGSARIDAHTTWAAGFRLVEEDDGRLTFVPVVYSHDDRRDGPWTEVPLVAGITGRVNAVAASSARDAWLVGDSEWEGEPVMTQHWDGRSWQYVPAALPPGASGGGLLSVDALARGDAWAAGWVQVVDRRTPDPNGGPDEVVTHNEGLVQHWDGRAWHPVPLPKPYRSWGLNAIAASGPDDVWAVGSGFGEDDRPVVLHYDGRSWTALPTPPYGGVYGEFDDVVVNGPQDVWAVGRVLLDGSDRGHALVMHWDGRNWTRADATAEACALTGAAAAPGGGLVAVGRTTGAEGGCALRVTGTRVASLGLPEQSPTTTYAPWKVAVSGREVTVSGSFRSGKPQTLQPLLLSTRL